MEQSLFAKHVSRFMPVLQRLVEKVNGKRNANRKYLHKGPDSILRTEYAPDNKWESTSVNTTYVAADYVAQNSPLPIKTRDVIASANGKLPKVGMKKHLKESEINTLNVMEAQGGNAQKIARKLADDAVACSVGIDEKNEYALLFGLSNGYVALFDEDNPDALMRISFNYLDENTLSTEGAGVIEVADLKRLIEKADADGNAIIKLFIAKSAYDALRNTRGAKELVASYNGQTFTDSTALPVPTAKRFNEAFADDNNGVVFEVIDRTVITERDGKRNKSVKPWNKNRVVGVCNEYVGTLVYGRLAEQSNPVKNVDYQTIDGYKLISKYSTNDPLVETTSGQAFVAPIIEDVDQIYILDSSKAESVDETEEAKDTTDVKVTVWGVTYKKAEFVAALKAYAPGVKSNASDAAIIKAVNTLSESDKAALKEDAESAKSTATASQG